MRKLSVLILAVILSACAGTTPPPPTPPPPPPPPPVDPHPPLNTKFNWQLARGFSLFAGARANEDDIRNLYDTFREKWPHLRLTARVCGELQSWPTDVAWLPRGVSAKPFDETAPAYKELKHFLDVAVTIPDAQVLVVPICNLKEDGTSPANRLKWVTNVCRLIGSTREGTLDKAAYPNVAIEIANEYIHPNSTISTAEMRQLIRACRVETGRAAQIGTDTNINERRREYDPELADEVDFYSYHPWRNPDPTQQDLRGIVRDWIGRTVFSETTAYADSRWGRLGGCCTDDKQQIDDYARHAEKAGGVFFYHMVWGLCWPEDNCPIGYILPRGDWEIRHGR